MPSPTVQSELGRAPTPGRFLLWPWFLAAALLAAGAALASPGLVRHRLPPGAEHYAAFVISGIAVARLCLVACAAFSVFTAFALKRWGGLVQCEPAPQPTRLFLSGRALCAALFALAILLRLPTIGASFWMDEMNTVERIIDKGLPVVLAFSSEGNNHPMNTLLMYLCEKLLGETEWVLRLPVLLLGALTPPAIFLCLRRLVPAGAALTAAALATVHFRCVEFSANARGYAGVILFSTIACCLFAEMWGAFRWKLAAAYIAAAAVTAAFVPTTLYVAGAHALLAAVALAAAWFRGETRARVARASVILGACLWACLLGFSANSLTLPQLIDYSRNGAQLAHKYMGPELLTGIAYFMAGSSHLPVAFMVLLASAIGLFRFRALPWLLPRSCPAGVVHGRSHRSRNACFPRMFVQFIFPCIAGFALFLYSEWRKNPAAPPCGGGGAFDGLPARLPPAVRTLLHRSNPGLKLLAQRLEGSTVMLVGDQADLNSYYFQAPSRCLPARWIISKSAYGRCGPDTWSAAWIASRCRAAAASSKWVRRWAIVPSSASWTGLTANRPAPANASPASWS